MANRYGGPDYDEWDQKAAFLDLLFAMKLISYATYLKARQKVYFSAEKKRLKDARDLIAAPFRT